MPHALKMRQVFVFRLCGSQTQERRNECWHTDCSNLRKYSHTSSQSDERLRDMMVQTTFTTLTVWTDPVWDNSPVLTAWTIRERPPYGVSRHPRSLNRPKRLRMVECRRVFSSPTTPLPSIHVHGPNCRCGHTQAEDQVQEQQSAENLQVPLLTQSVSTTCGTLPRMSAHPHQHHDPRSRSRLRSILSTFTQILRPSRLSAKVSPGFSLRPTTPSSWLHHP